MQIENTAASTNTVDTNEEYIIPQNAAKEPPVLGAVFKAVIVETVKDFFGSIIGFFLRYIKHFLRSFLYFWTPTLRKGPFDKLDYKENCQHSFELALLVLFWIIFAIKVNWIPQTSEDNLQLLSDDRWQMLFQFVWFLIFAASYFFMAIVSMITGRLFRAVLKINISKRESDILFIYLNNAFFSITSIIALCVRAITSLEMSDSDTIGQGLALIFLPTCFILILLWTIRFALMHKLGFLKGFIFFLLSSFIFTFLFAMGGAVTSIFFVVV